jgi:hypothetical protein
LPFSEHLGNQNIFMKKILLIVATSTGLASSAQQILSNSYYGKSDPAKAAAGSDPNFRIYGVGNISDETLKNLNAGGKAVFAFYPNPGRDSWQGNYFVSYNKNATNTDSALSTTLVFPESGNHSFLLHGFWKTANNPVKPNNYRGLFAEFAFKKITNKKDTADPKFQEFSFNTLHYTVGYKWGFSKQQMIGGKNKNMGVELSVFGSAVNIPNEDHANFEKIINRTATTNAFCMAGFKISFDVNSFQIFSDIRHVFGSSVKLPINDLKGFNYNIGVSFNTEVFEF